LGIETEIKVKIRDVADFCSHLTGLQAGALSDRHFEDNYLLDFPDERLKSSRCLIRVRFVEGSGVLTYKGPPRVDGIFKTREELETRIEDGATLLQVLEKIGMQITFRYQKYRREFALDGVHVTVDETPIGNYAEFEGSEEGIRALARRMGIEEARFLRLSYYSLYLEYCQEKGKDPEFMVF
jgi:adenylate cyclase, class 2